MRAEHVPRLGLGIQPVGESGFDARGLVEEREGADRRLDPGWKARAVLLRLKLDRQGRSSLLGLDHAHGLLVHVQQVVGEAVGSQGETRARRPPGRPGGVGAKTAEAAHRMTPLGRTADPREIAPAALFLA